MSVATMKLGEGLSVLQKLDLSLQEMLCMPTKALNQLAGEAQLTTAELAELKVCSLRDACCSHVPLCLRIYRFPNYHYCAG
jgi:hypothetical protein